MCMKKNVTKPTQICTCSLWPYWYIYRKRGVLTTLPCIWFSGFTATQNKLNDRNHKDCNLGPCDLWSQDIQCNRLHTALLLNIVQIYEFMLNLKISGFVTLFLQINRQLFFQVDRNQIKPKIKQLPNVFYKILCMYCLKCMFCLLYFISFIFLLLKV